MQRIAHYRLAASAFAVLIGVVATAASKTTPAREEWRASRIEALPSEVSRDLHKWQKSCGVLKARSSFSRTVEIKGHHYLALHFEELHCEDRTAICSASGCLHEVYEFCHGRFQKVTSLQTSELQITQSGNQAVLEFDCGLLGCLRALRCSKSPVGLTLSISPLWTRVDDFTGQLASTYAGPMTLLLDTAVVPNRLFAAMNVTYAPSVERMTGLWDRQSGLEVSVAVSGVVATGVLLGAEVRRASAYYGLFFNREDSHALYIGPSVFLMLPNDFTAKFVWSARASGAGEKFERNQVRAQLVKSF